MPGRWSLSLAPCSNQRSLWPWVKSTTRFGFTTVSGGQSYSPRNYDEKFEGTITLRRALAGSRNVPAVKLAEKVGISSVVNIPRRFGITTIADWFSDRLDARRRV